MDENRKGGCMKLGKFREVLANFKEDEEIYVAILGKEKAAVFDDIAVGENGNAIQLSAFAGDDPDGLAEVAVDVLKKQETAAG